MPDDSDVAEPLISHHGVDSQENGNDGDSGESTSAPGRFVWKLTFAAALSGLLFGYDTGVISATLVSIDSKDLRHALSTGDKSLITSITSLAALLSSPISGPLADNFGRKPVILFCDALFIVGALIQAVAQSVAVMTVGRAVVGLAIGAASALTPLYIAEMSPAKWRGRLVTVSALFITAGQVIAYVIGWMFAQRTNGWRWMVGLGAVPAFIQIVALLLVPESPRWLMKVGRDNDARRVLDSVYDGHLASVDSVLGRIAKEIKEECQVLGDESDGFIRKLRRSTHEIMSEKPNRRALTIACMLQGAQQICGFNSLMYFSATIFAMVGFKNPTATALLIACTNFFFTLIAFGAIDHIGRRRILLLSIPFMSIGLLISALAFTHVKLPPSNTSQLTALSLLTRAEQSVWPALLLTSLLLFVAAYALGLGNVPWHQSELFALSVRALGSALATSTNWGCNFLVGVSFLPMMEAFTPAVTMGIYAIICAATWFAVCRIYPETKGLSLEGVRRLLSD